MSSNTDNSVQNSNQNNNQQSTKKIDSVNQRNTKDNQIKPQLNETEQKLEKLKASELFLTNIVSRNSDDK